jgi:hypothetical protein
MKELHRNENKEIFGVKAYDEKTLGLVYTIFDEVVQECINYCECDLELNVPEKIEVKLLNSDEYSNLLENVFGDSGMAQMMAYGSSYTLHGKKYVHIHGCELNIGMTNWMNDFSHFTSLVNTIMSQIASSNSKQYIIRDKDFAKEQFEMVQGMVKKNKAA